MAARTHVTDRLKLAHDLESSALESGESGADDDERTPSLFHRLKGQASILALVVTDSKIYAGTQDGELLVWSLETYELLASISAHQGGLLGLTLSDDGTLLFSCGCDAIVNVWNLPNLHRLYSIYSTHDVGDVFCIAYSATLQSVYLGAQNTTVQWYDLSRRDLRPPPSPSSHPSIRSHRFFDSKGPSGVSNPRSQSADKFRGLGGQDLEIDRNHIIPYAHNGYVYCMLLAKNLNSAWQSETLITGGGDGVVKLWSTNHDDGGLLLQRTLENDEEAVLALALDGYTLYTGRLGGSINVWDLDTCQMIRRIKASPEDVLSLSAGHGLVFSGNSNGIAKIFNLQHVNVSSWKAHEKLILAAAVTTSHGKEYFVTGGNDGCLAIWDISNCFDRPRKSIITSNEELVLSLEKLVGYQTVSSSSKFAHDCRRGASFLRDLFKRFGAHTELFGVEDGRNPIVFARFTGQSKTAPTIMFYGHYDVIDADREGSKWLSDPFSLTATNGYLYGRGASDNKGPLLAAVYAAAELKRSATLDANVVFVIEGEEESGSFGFEKAIKRHKEAIGKVDWILLANSYWLTDDIPCLTYGLRGVIRASIEISSDLPDLHSGVDGSQLVHEPMKDLVCLLAQLSGEDGLITIPGFYDNVNPVTEVEKQRYLKISSVLLQQNPSLGTDRSLGMSLMARWQRPSLTIHRIESSGSGSSSTIPRSAKVEISMRLVPNQTVEEIRLSLQSYLSETFASMKSSNKMKLDIVHTAEAWLGEPSSLIYKILESAIVDAWRPATAESARNSIHPLPEQTTPRPATSSTLSTPPPSQLSPSFSKPLYIREGGSIPAIRFLEVEFSAPAAHLPCGQASDSAHLVNERFRVVNLFKAREIFKRVFVELGSQR